MSNTPTFTELEILASDIITLGNELAYYSSQAGKKDFTPENLKGLINETISNLGTAVLCYRGRI